VQRLLQFLTSLPSVTFGMSVPVARRYLCLDTVMLVWQRKLHQLMWALRLLGTGGVKSLAPGEQTLKGNEGLLEPAVVCANLKACLPPLQADSVLVTTRPLLAGEELLFDYCLPRSSRPAWYHEPQKDQKSGLTES